MTYDSLLPVLLLVQGVLGGIDTLVNHEIIARLPRRPQAHTEIGLHSIREAIYALLFGGIAWFEWHGVAALFIAALVIGEVVVSSCDEFVENRTRVLPQNERIIHVFLTINLGAIIALLVPTLRDWYALSNGLSAVDHGLVSWGLTVLALFGAGWSVRDVIAWRTLGKRRNADAARVAA